MNKELIQYKEALALKELNFSDECFAKYRVREVSFKFCKVDLVWRWTPAFISKADCMILAPLYQQAFRWFREVHNLKFKIDPINYFYEIQRKDDTWMKNGDFKSYEEAQFECLKKLIKIVKNK